MFDYIKGLLVAKNTYQNMCMTVECNGIGYLINSNLRTLNCFETLNSEIKVYLSLIHKEDAMGLCGFATKEDRDIFNILQSVSGVGMKSALVLLNEFSGCELISAVINEDYTLLSKAKGIGPKLAKKIIIELKDKLVNLQNKIPFATVSENGVQVNEITQEAQSVLLSLGYTPDEIKQAILFAETNNKCETSEDFLKSSLQYLSSNY